MFKIAALQAHFTRSTSARGTYAAMAAGNDNIAHRVRLGRPLKFLDESPEEPALQPDAVLPAHFYNGRRGSAGLEPIRRLMMAILVDAIGCYQRNLGVMVGRKRRDFKEAECWLFEEKTESFFSFAHVCDVLNTDPGRLRQAVMQWRRAKVAGAGPARMIRRLPVKTD